MEHLIIQGGDQYLPFARNCVRALQATGLEYASRNFEVDGVSIRVKVTPAANYIWISGGAYPYYEFVCSDAGYTVLGSGALGVPGASSPIYPGEPFMTGCGVVVEKTAYPVFSETLVDTESPSRWPMSTIDYLLTTGNTSTKTPEYGTFYTFASRPNQNFHEYHWWYKNKPGYLVTSCCANGRGRSWTDTTGEVYSCSFAMTAFYQAETGDAWNAYNQPNRSVVTNPRALAFSASFFSPNYPYCYLKSTAVTEQADLEVYPIELRHLARSEYSVEGRSLPAQLGEGEKKWDIVPTSYSNTVKFGATQRSVDTNWRHAAVHVATDESGASHRFFISTDTHGAFTFYREKNYANAGFDIRNIPEDQTKVVRVAYPAWVTVIPEDQSTTANHWQWSFNDDATRASTTPLNQEDLYINVSLQDCEYLDGYPGSGSLSTSQGSFNEATIYMPHSGLVIPPSTGSQGRTSTYLARTFIERVQVFRLKPGTSCPLPIGYTFTLDNFQLGLKFGTDMVVTNKIGVVKMQAWYSYLVTPCNPVDFFVDQSNFEPVKVKTPGFVEVEINITFDNEGDFFPTVSVVDAEQYSDGGKYYMDTGYYIGTKRAASGVKSGTLLTGEIEILADREQIPLPLYVPRGKNIESIGVGKLGVYGAYVYYTVKNRATQEIVHRLCLGENIDVEPFLLNPHDYIYLYYYKITGGYDQMDYYVGNVDDPNGASLSAQTAMTDTVTGKKYPPATFFGCVEQAELRFLSFLTTSYSRRFKPGVFGANHQRDRLKYMPHFLRPRFEMRVLGDPIETIDYSRPEVTGFAAKGDVGYDPMAETEPPESAIDRSLLPEHFGSYLAAKHYIAANHFQITHNDVFSFNPSGSWAIYSDRRSIDMPLSAESTAQTGVFDFIFNQKDGKTTSHKDAFNSAFHQTRDYSFYDHTTGDLGGFGAGGIWSSFKPAPKEPTP